MKAILAQLLPLSLLSLAPLGPVATAQEGLDLPQKSPAKKHVLHLVDGQVLRVRARLLEADEPSWEIRAGREWIQLPAAQVKGAALESDLLKEARSLERGLEKDDLARRAMYADWLALKGLQPEALEELDHILGEDPDQEEARTVLGRAGLPVALPDPAEDLGTFFDHAAKTSPAIRELAVQRLAALEGEAQREVLEEKVLSRLVERSPKTRAFASLAMRRLFPGEHVRPLLSRALLDVSEDVRTSASLSLRAANDEALVVPVLKALGSKNDKVRLNAATALGTMNYAAAAQPLYTHLVALQTTSSGGAPRSHVFFGKQSAYIQDFDVEVASAAAIADPVINVLTEGVVLDAAVIGVHEYVVQRERAAVRRSLGQITGANPGNTTKAWKAWWSEYGSDWNVKVASGEAPTSGTSRGH